jgi:hypothetical protein
MFGEWLSLVEHLVRDQGVGGSNPLSPTKAFRISGVVPVYPIFRLIFLGYRDYSFICFQ